MSDWTRHLTDEELRDVKKAFVEMGLVSNDVLRVLVSSVDKQYAATLPGSPIPLGALQIHLSRMNGVANLRNGEVPLAKYLNTAIELSGDQEQVTVLEDALKRVNAIGESTVTGMGIGSANGQLNTDIQPELMIAGVDDTIPVRFLGQALEATKSVFRLLVHRHSDGEGEFLAGDIKRIVNGTGWMIGPRILITNHHVINARSKGFVTEPDATEQDFRLQAENTEIDFDYLERDRPSHTASTGQGALLASNAELDFALLRVPVDAPERPPLKLRKRHVRKTLQQALGTRVNVLQHPNGDPMRLGFRENYVVFGDTTILSYLTDTAGGSSGSPVSDDSWSVAALHSGSQSIRDIDITIRGKKVKRENFGIPVTTIMSKLESDFPAIYQEVKAAQDLL